MILLFESDTLKIYTSENPENPKDEETLHVYENGKEVATIKGEAFLNFDQNLTPSSHIEFDIS